ncbi:MAG TPA: hypothetical protein VML96_06855 [Egibacteraceae bacterium]|nr:hypothetical protein [Egibacteraceae bacterium]
MPEWLKVTLMVIGITLGALLALIVLLGGLCALLIFGVRAG